MRVSSEYSSSIFASFFQIPMVFILPVQHLDWWYMVGPRHTRNWLHLSSQTPPKKGHFWGGGLDHRIFFSILEIRPSFKILKTSKVSFGSIWNNLVNTWSTLISLYTNQNQGFRKISKKCHFFGLTNFLGLLNQDIDVFTIDNVIGKVLKGVEEYIRSVWTIFLKIFIRFFVSSNFPKM